MNAQEMNEVWRVIGTYRQGDRRLRDEQLLKAWYAAMRVFTADDVKAAVIQHFRTSSFFPDVSEIVARLPRRPKNEPVSCDAMSPTEQASMDRMRRWQKGWHEELHALGLPTLREAIAAGTSLTRWRAMLSEAGVWEDK